MVSFTISVILLSCNSNKDCDLYDEYKDKVNKNNFCQMYNDAKWYFYVSNIGIKIHYNESFNKVNIKKSTYLYNVAELKINTEIRNDTLLFYIAPSYEKYDLWSVDHLYFFCVFGFNIRSGKLIFRNKCSNDYLIFKIPKHGNLIYSFDNNKNLNEFLNEGVYPIDFQEYLLIMMCVNKKIKNKWLLNYVKQKKSNQYFMVNRIFAK